MSYKPTGKTYTIATIKELFELPREQRLRCAEELLDCVRTLVGIEILADLMHVKTDTRQETFVWVDDGEENITLNFKE